MTSRATFLSFAVLLLLASLAGAASPVQSSAPASAAFMTPTSPVQNGTRCNSFLTSLGTQDLSPLASALNATGALCGECSDPVCQHATINQVCGRQGAAFKACVSLLGDRCSQDNNFNCTCYYGPLP